MTTEKLRAPPRASDRGQGQTRAWRDDSSVSVSQVHPRPVPQAQGCPGWPLARFAPSPYSCRVSREFRVASECIANTFLSLLVHGRSQDVPQLAACARLIPAEFCGAGQTAARSAGGQSAPGPTSKAAGLDAEEFMLVHPPAPRGFEWHEALQVPRRQSAAAVGSPVCPAVTAHERAPSTWSTLPPLQDWSERLTTNTVYCAVRRMHFGASRTSDLPKPDRPAALKPTRLTPSPTRLTPSRSAPTAAWFSVPGHEQDHNGGRQPARRRGGRPGECEAALRRVHSRLLLRGF